MRKMAIFLVMSCCAVLNIATIDAQPQATEQQRRQRQQAAEQQALQRQERDRQAEAARQEAARQQEAAEEAARKEARAAYERKQEDQRQADEELSRQSRTQEAEAEARRGRPQVVRLAYSATLCWKLEYRQKLARVRPAKPRLAGHFEGRPVYAGPDAESLQAWNEEHQRLIRETDAHIRRYREELAAHKLSALSCGKPEYHVLSLCRRGMSSRQCERSPISDVVDLLEDIYQADLKQEEQLGGDQGPPIPESAK
jgi:flagellar biosynthesis GTPase FlhF